MAVGMLRDDLLSLPGVESARIDGDAMAPTGVRVHLAPDVDAAAVGDEIKRVLSLHGLRSEVGVNMTAPVATPGEAAAVDRAVAGSGIDRATESSGLASVRVTEGREGVYVEALADGAAVSVRAAGAAGPAFDQAVVSAVAELAGATSNPLVRSVDLRDIGGTSVVTIVIDEAGDRLVGSSIVEGGRAYAVGRAAWAALSSR
ncbi:MAG: hypothetical protein U9R47_05045 [Actinomycetota bacterium]|nr:hypothetical protein [Actinomycetota bacterium]